MADRYCPICDKKMKVINDGRELLCDPFDMINPGCGKAIDLFPELQQQLQQAQAEAAAIKELYCDECDLNSLTCNAECAVKSLSQGEYVSKYDLLCAEITELIKKSKQKNREHAETGCGSCQKDFIKPLEQYLSNTTAGTELLAQMNIMQEALEKVASFREFTQDEQEKAKDNPDGACGLCQYVAEQSLAKLGVR